MNGIFSFIRDITIRANGVQIFSAQGINYAVNIKNLLEFSRCYYLTFGSSEFYYLDTDQGVDDTTNLGFKARLLAMGTSLEVQAEVRLNRIGFFESLRDFLLPSLKIEIEIDLESNENLIFRHGNGTDL